MFDAFGRPQTVVVLGGTSDIASSLIEALVAGGCQTVVLAGRDRGRLDEAASRAVAGGASSAPTVVFDATRPQEAKEVIDRCVAAAGGSVDLVVVAVGALGEQESDVTRPERVAESVTVNFTWPAAALAEVAVRLRAQGQGRVVVLSSIAGVRVRPANYLYGSAKRGLDAFAVSLGEDLTGTGVSVHVVRPGFVRSKMTAGLKPAPFAVSPADVTAAVQRGITDDERVVWVPGVLRWVSVLMRLVPPALWRRLPG
ncbi:MAG: SDR family NAD(P)-dependent oxidoreductase [Acidimicrobiales bacterium]